ncbi:hypothetical protein ACX4MY_10760 [Roseomonas mucosa]|nr:hypothetical protein [Roseomonas mucosa]MBS5904719.1 hypothetical protein [Acetobacteraceae bacterium]HWL81594.1 hypothetical protein [Roseomonas sp.]MDT8288404.1 hypothetical protein [Roseomonas mucosa]MDT8313248.1 hypothetical protein [Roseomonas mucosa]MDT8349269.1 hypothetical protein [Roseomonas mucosa]
MSGPPQDWEAAQAEEAEDAFLLTVGEKEARVRFLALCQDTREALTAAGERVSRMTTWRPQPHSAFNFILQRWLHDKVSPEIVERWQNWKQDYEEMVSRNPRLELADALAWISESDNASSWPHCYEDRLRKWVDSGVREPLPVHDSLKLLTPVFYERLGHLRAVTGGWLYYDEGAGRVVFRADDA